MTTAPMKKKSIFNRPEKPYVHPYFGGTMLGIVLFLAFFITGNGLGASGAISRIDVAIQDAIVPAHVDNTPYLLKMAGGDKNPLDDWIIPVFFGALLGGFSSGLFNGRFKLETNKGPRISNR
ncbi:MAG TPA: YeeE/YedE thiosulfate transporter family protein, partial [Anaerolineales bacterium]|nr:YeeE/YedE thiosulfate transporter family protein [Anaerolineales bacterium]